MKTVDDYLVDPRLANDDTAAGILEPEKRLHAIRLKTQDETAHMSLQERIDFINHRAEAVLAPYGVSVYRVQ